MHGLSAWDALMAAAKAGRTHLVKGVQYVPGLLTWDVRASGSNCQSAPSHDFAICTNTSDTANGTSVTAAPDAAAAPAACGGPAGAALAHSNGAAPPQPPPSSALEALARLGDSCMDVDPRRRPTAAAVLDALYAITALVRLCLVRNMHAHRVPAAGASSSLPVLHVCPPVLAALSGVWQMRLTTRAVPCLAPA